jgi:hypothetical protein
MDKCYRCSSKSTWWVVDDRGIPKHNICCCDDHLRSAVSRIFRIDKVTMSAVVRPYKEDE